MKRLFMPLVGAIFLVPTVAVAAPKGVYPKWTISPDSPGAQTHTGTIKFGVNGIPNATYKVEKDNDDGRSVRLETSNGGGDWLTAATPFGKIFGPSGPSDSNQYLRVAQDSSGDGNVSTTTITFPSAVPVGLVGIAVGDLDVDEVTVSAADSAFRLKSGSAIQGSASPVPFNFCNVPDPKPDNCGSDTDVPTWNPGPFAGILRGTGDDSDGASGWFRPTFALRQLTLEFTGSDGYGGSNHSYRTWLAALSNDISGKVTRTTGRALRGVLVSLQAPGGKTAAKRIRTDARGRYSFPNWAARSGYTVKMAVPSGYTASGATTKGASIAVNDATVDFKLKPAPAYTG
ncbi:MAG: carboxypeptidase-like regulatory domain-containing protein [Actinomycetes bacterium]